MNRQLGAQLQSVYRTCPWSSWAAHCCSTHWTWTWMWTRTHRLWPARTAPSAASRRQPRWCHCPSVALRPRDCFVEAGVDHPGCRWTCLRGREGHGGRAHVPAHTAVGACATHIAGQDHIAVHLFCIERNCRIGLKFQNLLISLTYTIVHLLYKCCHKETQKSEGFISVYDFGSNSKLEEYPFSGENTSWKIQKVKF